MREPSTEARELVAGSKHFARLPGDLVDAILERMVELMFEPGSAVIRQDDPGDSLLMLMDGTCRVYVTDEEGVEHDVSAVTRSDLIGEMALVTGARRSANVVAVTPVRALALGADDFHELARAHPQLGVVLSHLVADRLGGERRDILGDKVLDGYRIVRSIGQGGMSVVYEAERLDRGDRVAVKMMSHRLVYDPAASVRFREEAEIGETLDHPNIVKLLSRFSAYGTHFLVMELCDGPGLDEVLERQVPIPEELVRPVVGQLAEALTYVHDRGLIHRDVKASNVRLNRDGSVKLMDFGLAKPTLAVDDRTETHELALVGTPSYMAPEQFDGDRLDYRVDIYALACLTFMLMTGRKPFTGKSLARLIREKLFYTVPTRDEFGTRISPEMHRFLDAGMRADRDDRLDSLSTPLAWSAPVDVAQIEALTRLPGDGD